MRTENERRASGLGTIRIHRGILTRISAKSHGVSLPYRYKIILMRQLLHLLVGLSVSITPFSSSLHAQALLDPKTQPQFINPLPVPPVIDARQGGTFTIPVSQFEQHLGLVDPVTGQPLMTTVWGYNGSYPGPTIAARKGVPVHIFWTNNLVDADNKPLPHLLPVDETLHWAFSGDHAWRAKGVPIVTHLHGGQTESASDGLPDAWYTPNFTYKGKGFIKGQSTPYQYDNNQEAATIWYHDHALGITRLNVYAGLAGYYLVTDDHEQALKAANQLPADPYDLGLAIQDRMFTRSGQLYYPTLQPEEEDEEVPENSTTPEFFGDFILVNGKTWPVLEVEPRPYRFRILNGSDSRYYNLFLSSGQQFIQVASDDGLLPAPVAFNQLLIGTGERRDVVIDFSNPALRGQTIILRNNARTPFPKGETVDPLTTGRIMAFRVTKPRDPRYPLTSLPAALRAPLPALPSSDRTRKLLLFEGEDEYSRINPLLGTVDDKGEGTPLGWMDSITENPALGSTEVWEFYNTTADAHTIHLHMVKMQLINRQRIVYRQDEETGKVYGIRTIGQPKTPGPEEQGWKDTYIMYPGEVTRAITTFRIPGPSVWHCHILSHEDHEMMRPYFIGTMENTGGEHITVQAAGAALEKQVNLEALPNPFNSRLDIRFRLPEASPVVINVYDGTGKRIQQVFHGQRSAGLQQFHIDGSKWSNGTYFCEVVIGGQRMVRKLTLQK